VDFGLVFFGYFCVLRSAVNFIELNKPELLGGRPVRVPPHCGQAAERENGHQQRRFDLLQQAKSKTKAA